MMNAKELERMAAGQATLTQDRLKELLSYDPETGVFRWKSARTSSIRAGRQAGYLNATGYRTVVLDKRKHWEHRLAWLYVHGKWPEHYIDHINGVKDDNRICNLRDVTKQLNQQNEKRARSSSKSGFLGVTHVKRHLKLAKPFAARIWFDKKLHSLGHYATAEEAHAVYVDAKRKLHAGFAL